MNAMQALRSLVVAVVGFVVLTVPSMVLADGRVALMVGNSTYAHIGRLPNPDNDARDMSAALRRLGFEVTTELDANRVELTEALRAFTRQSAGADVSLVFYAGHGIEMDGVNYLVPVDARLERDVDVRFEAVTVDDLLVSTSGASLRLLILDACRNNPLSRSMQRTTASRSVSGGSFADLNEDLLGDETLVAYAAAGTTAADGRGRNSPYTAALLSHLETPLEIGLLFRRVRAQVLAATNGAQRPHEYHSLVGEHYLTRTLASGAAVTVSAAAPATLAPVDPPRPDPPEIDVTDLPIAALRELAEAGDVDARTELGERYEHGRGVVQDYTVAVSWFRRAAEQGYAPGQAALGFMYGTGRGVRQDDAESVRWFRRAVEQGNTRGQNNLGVMYATGRGLERNDAVRWYRRAAERGNAFAQDNLGAMYRDGRGVAQDYGEAARWFRRSADQGHASGQNIGRLSPVYYAGHGIEMDSVNYLVPVAARLERDVDVRFETVTVDDLLVSTSGAPLRLVILDACPEQPAGALEAAYGRDPYGQRRQLREPERGSPGRRDAGGVCGGGDGRGGRSGPEQPVHGGAAVASGDAAGDRPIYQKHRFGVRIRS